MVVYRIGLDPKESPLPMLSPRGGQTSYFYIGEICEERTKRDRTDTFHKRDRVIVNTAHMRLNTLEHDFLNLRAARGHYTADPDYREYIVFRCEGFTRQRLQDEYGDKETLLVAVNPTLTGGTKKCIIEAMQQIQDEANEERKKEEDYLKAVIRSRDREDSSRSSGHRHHKRKHRHHRSKH